MAKGKGMAFRGGISELMKQAHRIQTKLEKVKEDIKTLTWTAETAGGKIKTTINGSRELTQIHIDKDLVNPEDLATLQDAIVSAVNAAIKLADEKINEATKQVTGNVSIPGMF